VFISYDTCMLEPSEAPLDEMLDSSWSQFRKSFLGVLIYVENAKLGLEHADRFASAVRGRISNPTAPFASFEDEQAARAIERLSLQRQALMPQFFAFFDEVNPNNMLMMMNMAFVYLIAIFEAFGVDICSTVLIAKPEMLRAEKKTLSYEKILALGSIERLIRHMATRELYEVSYKSVEDQWEIYQKRFGIQAEESGVSLSLLADMTAQRNLLVHNNGVVNERYFEAVTTPTLQMGEHVEIDDSKLNSYAHALEELAKYTVGELKEEHCKSTTPKGEGQVPGHPIQSSVPDTP
jgi:hypothetical protein